jgi:DNA recombination protein RmuC
MTGSLLIGLVLGLVVGAVGAALVLSARQGRTSAALGAAEARLADARAAVDSLTSRLDVGSTQLRTAEAELARTASELEHERRRTAQRDEALEADLLALRGTFAELSADALKSNAEQFLTLADARMREAQEVARGELSQRQQAITQLLAPLQETLQRYQEGLRQLELEREGAYRGLAEQVKALAASHDGLQRETRSLATALRAPQTRGRWGEMQLRRVLEMAGMVAHCDFTEQVTSVSDQGRRRPDVVVHLAGGAEVVVDAKVPLEAFLRAAEAADEEGRRAELAAHARQLRTHVDQLARKEYWQQFDPSPTFVVAFVPGDALLAAAFEHDPGLLEHGMASRVLVATPTTLIALLRSVAVGWQQEALAENARTIQRYGAELYDRLRVLGGHLARLQRGLTSSVEAFNETVGSLESRVLVTARRFPDLGVTGPKELGEIPPVTAMARMPQAPELLPAADRASEPPAWPALRAVGETSGSGGPDGGPSPADLP